MLPVSLMFVLIKLCFFASANLTGIEIFKYPSFLKNLFYDNSFLLRNLKMNVILAKVKHLKDFSYSHIHVLLIIATWLYLFFSVSYCNKICQVGRSDFADLTLQVMMASPQLGHTTDVNDLISTCTRPVIGKLGRMVDQYT